MGNIPDWAARALYLLAPTSDDQDSPAWIEHAALEARVTGRWLELQEEFVPTLSKLDDTGKTAVFEAALWVARHHSVEWRDQARSDWRSAKSYGKHLGEALSDLVDALDKIDALEGAGKVRLPVPTIFDVIERAAERFPEWEMVAQQDLRRFLSHRTQSRPKPALRHFAQAALDLWNDRPTPEWRDPSYHALETRKRSLQDFSRMIDQVTRGETLGCPSVPDEFTLSSPAIAVLVRVTFDLDSDAFDPSGVRHAQGI